MDCDQKCPFKDNPSSCVLADAIHSLELRMIKLESHYEWLKRGYWIQTAFALGTLLATLSLIITLLT